YLRQAEQTGSPPQQCLASLLRSVWHSLRNLAGDRPYPPEPKPPRSCAQAIRLLDLVIQWCNRQTALLARAEGDYAEELSVVGASVSSGREAAEEEFSKLLAIKREIDPDDKYIGESPEILRVLKKIHTYNKNLTKPILIVGPTGSGKTGIADLVHEHSKRNGPFCTEQATDNIAEDFGITKGRWVGFGKGTGLPNIP